MTGNGRLLHPAGRLTTLGNFPTGAALSPDGRFLWVVDAGHGQDDVKVVNVATGAVTQTLALPGGYVGVAFAPDGRHAYVSGDRRPGVEVGHGRERGRLPVRGRDLAGLEDRLRVERVRRDRFVRRHCRRDADRNGGRRGSDGRPERASRGDGGRPSERSPVRG